MEETSVILLVIIHPYGEPWFLWLLWQGLNFVILRFPFCLTASCKAGNWLVSALSGRSLPRGMVIVTPVRRRPTAIS